MLLQSLKPMERPVKDFKDRISPLSCALEFMIECNDFAPFYSEKRTRVVARQLGCLTWPRWQIEVVLVVRINVVFLYIFKKGFVFKYCSLCKKITDRNFFRNKSQF